jgi:hypothetical protein
LNLGSSAAPVQNLYLSGNLLMGGSPGTTTTVLHGNASGASSFGPVVENDLSISDVTTANASTSKHGLMPKRDGNANHFFNGNNSQTAIPQGAFSFATLTTPDSNGTNWIPNCSASSVWAVYTTILLTNDIYIPYITNGPGAISLALLPNGANRTLSVNSNWCVLSTNNWTLNTALNPGVYQTTITNAPNLNGGRQFWLSMVLRDAGSASQTSVTAKGSLSP